MEQKLSSVDTKVHFTWLMILTGGPPVMDFQDELRKKLNKRFIYETPEALRSGNNGM